MSSFFGLYVSTLLMANIGDNNTSLSGKTRTFKPRKDVPEGTKQYQLRKYAEATLVGHPPRGQSIMDPVLISLAGLFLLGIRKSEVGRQAP